MRMPPSKVSHCFFRWKANVFTIFTASAFIFALATYHIALRASDDPAEEEIRLLSSQVAEITAKQMGLICFELKRYKEAETYLGYVMKAGVDCPECPLLLTTIRESLGAY